MQFNQMPRYGEAEACAAMALANALSTCPERLQRDSHFFLGHAYTSVRNSDDQILSASNSKMDRNNDGYHPR